MFSARGAVSPNVTGREFSRTIERSGDLVTLTSVRRAALARWHPLVYERIPPIIKGAELLFKTSEPTESQIRSAMNGHICRCGTYPRIMSAIQRAARAMATSRRTSVSDESEGATHV